MAGYDYTLLAYRLLREATLLVIGRCTSHGSLWLPEYDGKQATQRRFMACWHL